MKDLFGKELPEDSRLRSAIGQAVIDTIVQRTQNDNKSWSGKPFDAYSASYGKKGPVDLTLTGDMLGNMDIAKETRNTIEIAIDDSDAPKAFNHITGDTLPPRDFFGISASEARTIRSLFKDAVREKDKRERKALLGALVEQLVDLGEGK